MDYSDKATTIRVDLFYFFACYRKNSSNKTLSMDCKELFDKMKNNDIDISPDIYQYVEVLNVKNNDRRVYGLITGYVNKQITEKRIRDFKGYM